MMNSERFLQNSQMMVSLNCIFLGGIFPCDAFTVDVCEKNDINKGVVTFKSLKFGHLKYLIWDKKKEMLHYLSDPDLMKLWKVDISFGEKLKDITEEQIKNVGEELHAISYFQNIFKSQDVADKFLIIIQVPAAPVKTVEDIIKFVLKDSTSLTSQTHTLGSDTLDTDISQFIWHDMPLKDRNLSKIAAIVRDNVMMNSKALKSPYSYGKSEFNILVCGGAPGIGKTRLGKELFNNIQTNKKTLFEDAKHFEHFDQLVYIHLDFGNSIRLDKKDYLLENEKIICLRILYKYFIMEKYELSFEFFRERALPYIKILNFQNVFASIRKSLSLKGTQRLFVFLHIDEFQLIFKWDEGRKEKLFKYIIKVLAPEYMFGNGSNLTFVQEFLSGTARQAAIKEKEASWISLESIRCPMLSTKSMIQIVDFYAEKYGAVKINDEYIWKLCNPFLQIIQDTGGLPRALQFMLDICFNKLNNNGKEFFQDISSQNFGEIFKQTTKTLEEKYGIYKSVRENERLSLELLYCCMTEKPVKPEDCLDPKDETRTIQRLETDTHIILKESDAGPYYYIVMPFFFIVLYNHILKIVPNELEGIFNGNYSMHWQDWELFVANYEAFINNMLIVRENKSETTLRELYRGAYGKDSTLNKTVKLKVFQSLEQFPCLNLSDKHDNKQERNVMVVNGKGAPFGDSFVHFVAREILCDSEISNALMIVQNKWDYNGKELTKLEVIKECIKNLKNLVEKSESIINSYPDPCCIMILITMRRCDFDYDQLPEDVLVIDQTNFKEYFGPIFSSRAAFYLARDINPNFSELTKIKNIVPDVGTITAGRIIDKRPYLNLEDFSEKHKHIKRQKLDKANIKLEFFPFNI